MESPSYQLFRPKTLASPLFLPFSNTSHPIYQQILLTLLQNVTRLHPLLTTSLTTILVQTIIISNLVYCSSLLTVLPVTPAPLQFIFSTTYRVDMVKMKNQIIPPLETSLLPPSQSQNPCSGLWDYMIPSLILLWQPWLLCSFSNLSGSSCLRDFAPAVSSGVFSQVFL